jgi:hypothetical protein
LHSNPAPERSAGAEAVVSCGFDVADPTIGDALRHAPGSFGIKI